MAIDALSVRTGILAGGGSLPRVVADACKADGVPPLVIALKEHCDPSWLKTVEHQWMRLGEAGAILDALRDGGCAQVVMAGRVARPSLSAIRPDWKGTKLLAKIGARAFGGDDTLLGALADILESEGFAVRGAHDVAGNLLAPPGLWTTVEPDSIAWQDIQRGTAVLNALGPLDVGQAVVVQQGLVLAVEAIEGTDAMLERAHQLRRDGDGGVLVKLSKRDQDDRADLPTIGVSTMERAATAGLRGVAVEAGRTLTLDRAALVTAADAAGLFVVGVTAHGTLSSI